MIPDNYSQWERHEAEQEQRLSRLPVCDYCEQHIQDEKYYAINGDCVCPKCLEWHFKVDIEED